MFTAIAHIVAWENLTKRVSSKTSSLEIAKRQLDHDTIVNNFFVYDLPNICQVVKRIRQFRISVRDCCIRDSTLLEKPKTLTFLILSYCAVRVRVIKHICQAVSQNIESLYVDLFQHVENVFVGNSEKTTASWNDFPKVICAWFAEYFPSIKRI